MSYPHEQLVAGSPSIPEALSSVPASPVGGRPGIRSCLVPEGASRKGPSATCGLNSRSQSRSRSRSRFRESRITEGPTQSRGGDSITALTLWRTRKNTIVGGRDPGRGLGAEAHFAQVKMVGRSVSHFSLREAHRHIGSPFLHIG